MNKNKQSCAKTQLRQKSDRFRITLILVGLAAVFVGALFFGSSALSPTEALRGIFGSGGTASVIMRYVRLPRILAALTAGIGLSVSGILLQTVTDNSLASPGIIGVNSGAGLAVIIVMSFFPQASGFIPIAAFAGAAAATFIILFSAYRIGMSKISVILSGMAMNAVLNACISFISIIDTDVLSSYNFFSVGGVAGVMTNQLIVPSVMIFISFGMSLIFSRKIAVLHLGGDIAASLGINVGFMRTLCILLACASAASVVSFAGLLGFVGLIVPNMAKRICQSGSMAAQILASALIGGIIVIAADTIGRTIFAPTEVPVGIVMSLIGAPMFFSLLLRRQKNGG